MGNGPSLKNFGLCRPLIENKRKSITKEEIEVFCFHMFNVNKVQNTHTHTHTCLTALFPVLHGWAGTRKVKPIWISLKQDSEWQWHQLDHMQVCTSLQTDNQASTSPLSSLQAGCPSCRPTNSVKALKALKICNKQKNVDR